MNAKNQSQSNELAEKEKSSLVTIKRITGNKPQGGDDVDVQSDLKMPRLAILQPTSRMVSEDKGKIGDLAHSITKENYGKALEFIPLFMFKTRAQFEIGKGLMMLSRDNRKVNFGVGAYEKYIGWNVEDVPHLKDPSKSAIDWVGKEAPSFHLIYNFLIIRSGENINQFPMVLSLMRTSSKTAQNFLSEMTYSGEDYFARVYNISTKIEENEKGRFASPMINFVRRCTDQEYTIAQQRFQDFHKKRSDIEVDLESEAPQE